LPYIYYCLILHIGRYFLKLPFIIKSSYQFRTKNLWFISCSLIKEEVHIKERKVHHYNLLVKSNLLKIPLTQYLEKHIKREKTNLCNLIHYFWFKYFLHSFLKWQGYYFLKVSKLAIVVFINSPMQLYCLYCVLVLFVFFPGSTKQLLKLFITVSYIYVPFLSRKGHQAPDSCFNRSLLLSHGLRRRPAHSLWLHCSVW